MEHCRNRPPSPDPPTATSDLFFFSGDTDTNTMLTDFVWIGAEGGGGEGGLSHLPENNNQSLSSSSGDDPAENSAASDGKQLETPSKSKKKQKRMRQPRFAFMTKSETDHLEDGYRWRKYGQKAVKNSPFPRSYYRCTNSKCSVKKRVERSREDPSIVITTYEGQHCHHTAGGMFQFHRAGNNGIISSHKETTFANHHYLMSQSQFYYPPIELLPGKNTLISNVSQPCQVDNIEAAERYSAELLLPDSSTPEPPTDDGLLGDIVPRELYI